MNVTFNATFLDHYARSGLQVYTDSLLRALAAIDTGTQYHLIFTSLRRRASDMPGPDQGNFHKHVLRAPDRPFPFKDSYMNRVLLPGFCARMKTDVFHAPAGYTIPAVKAKKILTIHDLRSLKIADKTYPQDIAAYKRAFRQADTCITVSELTKKDIVEHLGPYESKIRVIYNGVDETFRPAPPDKTDAIREKYGLKEPYIFSVGLVPRKNVPRLIRAFSLCPRNKDVLLAIGGAGSDGPWMKEYRALAAGLGLSERVRFIGAIAQNDLPACYSASEFFIFPSLYEGFGLPMLEAMRCGAAVAASQTASLPEIGGDAALYFDPENEQSIADIINKLLGNTDSRLRLREKGFRRAELFTWAKTAEDTLRVYRE